MDDNSEKISYIRCNEAGEPIEVGYTVMETIFDDDGNPVGARVLSSIEDPIATAALPANMSAEDKRRAAYVAEADPIRAQAEGYETEAQVLRENGDTEKAEAAEAKARGLRGEYVVKKEEIRARIPDPALYLSSTGTYHVAGCQYATGEALTLADIAAANPEAKPCSRCGPPALG